MSGFQLLNTDSVAVKPIMIMENKPVLFKAALNSGISQGLLTPGDVIIFDLLHGKCIHDPTDFAALRRSCLDLGLFALGVRNYEPTQAKNAATCGLAPVGPEKSSPLSEKKAKAAIRPQAEAGRAHIVFGTVRSGQEIYAKDGDLVIIGDVNTGCEISADGDIHVYGSLRGRAIAGARGNADAFIMADKLDAELLAIAGVFVGHEAIEEQFNYKPVKIMNRDQKIVIRQRF